MFIAELTHPEFDRFDLTSLRTGVMAGAPCPIETMRRVVERMHVPELTIVYGQTETSPGLTMSSRGRSLGTARHHGGQAAAQHRDPDRRPADRQRASAQSASRASSARAATW
jgi:acyl-CoA synthetase (AMP-forming)/AMP-acid ligase II